MKPDYLKSMWEALKGLGQFPEFSSYAEYRQSKWGTEESSDEKQLEFLEELTPADKKDFLEVFGDN